MSQPSNGSRLDSIFDDFGGQMIAYTRSLFLDKRNESASLEILDKAKQQVKELFLELVDKVESTADYTDEAEDVRYYFDDLRELIKEL